MTTEILDTPVIRRILMMMVMIMVMAMMVMAIVMVVTMTGMVILELVMLQQRLLTEFFICIMNLLKVNIHYL